MNSLFLAVCMIASSLFIFSTQPQVTNPIGGDPSGATWNQSAVKWLLDAQSPNGGWGSGAHAYQNVTDPHAVQTDPATTSFSAMALLRAGGKLDQNPYKAQIMKALDRVLKDIDNRPDNGRITSLEGTQPQVKLGIHIDASMALQFLSEMREQLDDATLSPKIDKAAEVCITLIQGSQNANGGWAGGGWAPVLQSAMANNALEQAQKRYHVDQKVIDQSRNYQANNISTEGVKSEDAAGVPLYAAVSAQRATSADAKAVEDILAPATALGYSNGSIKKEAITKELQSKGMGKDKAEQMANSYAVNYTSTQALQKDDIWDGFGNNGGEEYLSYMMTSEALAQQGKEDWNKWRQSIEPKFKQSQNPNGSWSGQHCITSPVFCTAAVIMAWNAGNQ